MIDCQQKEEDVANLLHRFGAKSFFPEITERLLKRFDGDRLDVLNWYNKRPDTFHAKKFAKENITSFEDKELRTIWNKFHNLKPKHMVTDLERRKMYYGAMAYAMRNRDLD